MSDFERQARYRARHPERIKAAVKKWQSNHKDQVRELGRKHNAKRRTILNGLKNVPCTDCGERFPPVCMEFDHVRGVKSFTIGGAATRSIESILTEIEKCDVVCANCHLIRGERRRGK